MRTYVFKMLAMTFAAVGFMTAAAHSQEPTGAAPAQAPAATKPAVAETPPVKPFRPANAAEKAIVDQIGAFTKAYAEANAQALADLYADAAIIVDADGGETRGKPAIAQMYADSFQELKGLKLESHIQAVSFLTNDVARVEGQSRLSTPNGDASEFTRFSTLVVLKDGKWKIAEIREHAAPAEDVAPYERLKELEWMVGDWINEGADDKVTASVRWADGQSYLIRTYTVELRGEKRSSGTMFIGWDPQSGQIKSWLFDSQGGHGEGFWTRTGEDQWVVKAQGVLRDGLPTSATQVHTILNKDSAKTSSIDRIIGGQVAPDINDVVMVRKAPAPAASQPAATK
ncbi:YybH family protein [Paludisphaera borealis]|uniref:DUF4440 domain-containing protein n=1 Tax=Paludisphaera borealis TaxID=1387353 RepID=A0A1U7CTK7_9BACT|nr:SgcJ/EcaC family oxidoreductase [Paludisphaera borealis]APW62275.1 hypothetical protein BSF38_03814 [Paludisphaera borealis]